MSHFVYTFAGTPWFAPLTDSALLELLYRVAIQQKKVAYTLSNELFICLFQ